LIQVNSNLDNWIDDADRNGVGLTHYLVQVEALTDEFLESLRVQIGWQAAHFVAILDLFKLVFKVFYLSEPSQRVDYSRDVFLVFIAYKNPPA